VEPPPGTVLDLRQGLISQNWWIFWDRIEKMGALFLAILATFWRKNMYFAEF